ncbi:hypothetical protein NJBCHELONAE_01760 [Mycobacteroides chelonae]|uniref:hypothetical protein n=1 Tax=Mycobacteroides chelonae TaxID=1774 RepID=UPI0021DD6D20|nr:hypothetical protein [Mycobacteroides chelonae]GLE54865.1 hypothetical protein NJBCHELONAE_01760 [Mycobacteroides chelonae]
MSSIKPITVERYIEDISSTASVREYVGEFAAEYSESALDAISSDYRDALDNREVEISDAIANLGADDPVSEVALRLRLTEELDTAIQQWDSVHVTVTDAEARAARLIETERKGTTAIDFAGDKAETTDTDAMHADWVEWLEEHRSAIAAAYRDLSPEQADEAHPFADVLSKLGWEAVMTDLFGEYLES